MQKAAQDAGGSAIALDDATEQQFPDPELGKAVFAATPDTVAGPEKGALGWHVVKVTKVTPGSERSFDDMKDELRNQVLASKAADLMYDRANKVDNVLGTGPALDQMPSDLGLVGVAGTLDAQGNTQDGTPAPIPGPAGTEERADQGGVRRPRRAIRRNWSRCRRHRPAVRLTTR